MKLVLKQVGFERNEEYLFLHLNDVLNTGDLLQLRGPNGSGKSTLLRILAGFIKPQDGAILWEGMNIHEQRDHYQQQLHYLGHQNGIKQNLTVYENLQLSCAIRCKKMNKQTIDLIIKQIGLQHVAHTLALQLSAGQRRRISLGRLLLTPLPLWLLDEPTTALDLAGYHLFTAMLHDHLRQGGIAVVSTHHDLNWDVSLKTIELGARYG